MSVRLTTTFTNVLGKVYQIDIDDKNYIDPPVSYIAGGDGFIFDSTTAGDDYLHTPIIGTSVSIPINVVDAYRSEITQFLVDLTGSDENRFTVFIYENSNIYWRGKVQVERVRIPDSHFTQISLFAADGIGRLESIPYDDGGVLYEGWETLYRHIYNIINKLDLYPNKQDSQIGFVQNVTLTGINGRLPESLRVHHDAFKEIKGDEILPFDCLTVLKQLLMRFDCRIVQQDGIFFIQQISYLQGAGAKELILYDASGAHVSTSSSAAFNVSAATKLSGGQTFHREMARYVQIQYAYKDAIQGSNLLTSIINENTPTSIGDLPSGNGEVLFINFKFLINHIGDQSSQILFYVQHVFTIQVGIYYLDNSTGEHVWTTDANSRVRISLNAIEDAFNLTRLDEISIVTPAIPTDAEAYISWTSEPEPVQPQGVYTSTNVLNNVQLIYALGSPNEGTIVTNVTTGDVSGEKVEPNVLVTGDKPFLRSVGRWQYYDGTFWKNTFNTWGSGSPEGLNLDRWLAREIMAMQYKAIRVRSMIIRSDVNIANKIQDHIIMTSNYNAQRNVWSVEAFEPVYSAAGLVYTDLIETTQTGSLPSGVSTTTPTVPQLWQRTGTELTPATAGDNVKVVTSQSIAIEGDGVDVGVRGKTDKGIGVYGDSGVFGDFAKGDYIHFNSAGHVTLHGGATVWKSLRVPIHRGLLGTSAANQPTSAAFLSGLRVVSFNPDTMNELFFNVLLPFDYKEESELFVRVHFVPMSSAGSSTAIRWGFEYSWQNIAAAAPGSSTIIYSASKYPNENFVGYKHYTTDFAGITGVGKTRGSALVCRIFRDATNIADTFTGEAGLLEVSIRYESDEIGSNEII